MTQTRRPSPLQRRVLIVLAALDAKRPGPVATRDIERVLEQGGDAPVYGNNLRGSCRRMEDAGWLRTLRNRQTLQLAVELTDTGRAMATPLLADEQAVAREQQRLDDVRVLPVRPADTLADQELVIAGIAYTACRGAFVVRLDGTTCLQLWRADGTIVRLEGDALQVADGYQMVYDAGLPVQIQVNEGM
jgi:DNA-binding MarR family transcriptional regulator